jgi:hypothetical protein
VKLITVALVAFALSACGGSVVGAPADGGLRGSTAGDATPDAFASCPSAATLAPGGTCEAEDQTCPAAFTCGCGDSFAVSCTCSDGEWLCAAPSCGGCSSSCPDDPTPGQTCSFPAGMTCPGVLSCPGGSSGPIDVECMGGVWTSVSKDACPPNRCVAGGDCDLGACTLSGAGPCGSDEVLTCDGGSYVLERYTCSDEGAGCGTTGDGHGSCAMSCSCEKGLESCTVSGDCDAG